MRSLIEAILPVASKTTKEALINNTKIKKRIQLKDGECLTERETLEKLKSEADF